jgi:hypothetical protein
LKNSFFRYQESSALPPLAWCAVVERNNPQITIQHGPAVEAHPQFFAEAAWSGNFNLEGLHHATTVCGTAGLQIQEEVLFLTGSSQCSPLFTVRGRDSVYISNSMIYALVAAGDQPDSAYPFYAYDILNAYRQRLSDYLSGRNAIGSVVLPTAKGAELRIHFLARLVLSSDLQFKIQPILVDQPPECYSSLKRHLDETVSAVLANAAATTRRVQYESFLMISKGYDSPALASLAAGKGSDLAATVVDHRQADPSADSGIEIASLLGYQCKTVDRWDYLQQDYKIQAEFAWQTFAPALSFQSLATDLNKKILFSGVYGYAWQEWQPFRSVERSPYFRTMIAGLGQLEFRLRAGYLVFAVPSIGIPHTTAWNAISRSEEMAPWRLGGSYDAPIARRIGEEAGIPRQAFGIKKMATSQVRLFRPGSMSPEALDRYRSFRRFLHSRVPRLMFMFWRFCHFADSRLWVLLYGTPKRCEFFLKLPWKLTIVSGERQLLPWSYSFMLQWSFQEIKDRYLASAPKDYSH